MPQNLKVPDLDDIALDFHHVSCLMDMLVDTVCELSTEKPLHHLTRDQIVGTAAIVRDFAQARYDIVSEMPRTHQIAEKKGVAV